MGVTHIAFGFIVAILLTFSKVSRWWRILAAVPWLLGISTMIAAYKGLCVIMHHSHARNLRPWEQDLDCEIAEERRNSWSSTANRGVQMASRTGHHDESDKDDDASFRKSSLLTFGPENSFENDSWVGKYEQKPLLRKVFDQSAWTQNETLRIIQDRIVLGANLWGLMITIALTVIFVVLPKGNFY